MTIRWEEVCIAQDGMRCLMDAQYPGMGGIVTRPKLLRKLFGVQTKNTATAAGRTKF